MEDHKIRRQNSQDDFAPWPYYGRPILSLIVGMLICHMMLWWFLI